jgi:hypothetical protein
LSIVIAPSTSYELYSLIGELNGNGTLIQGRAVRGTKDNQHGGIFYALKKVA